MRKAAVPLHACLRDEPCGALLRAAGRSKGSCAGHYIELDLLLRKPARTRVVLGRIERAPGWSSDCVRSRCRGSLRNVLRPRSSLPTKRLPMPLPGLGWQGSGDPACVKTIKDRPGVTPGDGGSLDISPARQHIGANETAPHVARICSGAWRVPRHSEEPALQTCQRSSQPYVRLGHLHRCKPDLFFLRAISRASFKPTLLALPIVYHRARPLKV